MLSNLKDLKPDNKQLTIKNNANNINSTYKEGDKQINQLNHDAMILEMTNAINNYYTEQQTKIKDNKPNKELENFKKFFFPGLDKILNQIISSTTQEKERAEKIETVYKFYKGKYEYLKNLQNNIEGKSNKSNSILDKNQLKKSNSILDKNQSKTSNLLNLTTNPKKFQKEFKEKENLKMPLNYIYDTEKKNKENNIKKDLETENILPTISVSKNAKKVDDKEKNNLTKSIDFYDKNKSNNNAILNSTKVKRVKSIEEVMKMTTNANVTIQPNKKFGNLMMFDFPNKKNKFLKGNNDGKGKVDTMLSTSLFTNKLKRKPFEKTNKISIKKTLLNSAKNELEKGEETKDELVDIKEENELPIETKPAEEVKVAKPKLPLRVKFPNIKNIDMNNKVFKISNETIINMKIKLMAPKKSSTKDLPSNKSKSVKPELRMLDFNNDTLEKNKIEINVEVLTPSPISKDELSIKENQSQPNLFKIRDHSSEQENFLNQRRTLFEFRSKDRKSKKQKNVIDMNKTKKEFLRPDITYYPKFYLPDDGHGLISRNSDEYREYDKDKDKDQLESEDKKSPTLNKTKNYFLKTTFGTSKNYIGKLKIKT